MSGRNLFPNVISVEAHNFFKFSPYDSIPDEHHHTFTFTLDQMQADIRDVAFYFRKKSGIPKMSDSGLADVILGGNGLHVSSLVRSVGYLQSFFLIGFDRLGQRQQEGQVIYFQSSRRPRQNGIPQVFYPRFEARFLVQDPSAARHCPCEASNPTSHRRCFEDRFRIYRRTVGLCPRPHGDCQGH